MVITNRMPFLIVAFLVMTLGSYPMLAIAEDTTQDAAPQNVGGLLFDVDEGVELEQGPGGSVYVRSNREYMKKKFRLIDKKLSELEQRIESLEKKEMSDDSSGDGSGSDENAEGRRVLST